MTTNLPEITLNNLARSDIKMLDSAKLFRYKAGFMP